MLDVAPIRKHSQRRTEFFELLLPVEKRTVGRHNQERSPNIFVLRNVSQEGNRLDCLTEAHFIGQNTIDALLEQVVEPSQTFDLIFFQSTQEGSWSVYDFGQFSLIH